MSYWVCQGIGFEQSDLLPLLDGDKLKTLFADVTGGEWEDEYKFSTLTNEMKVEAIIKRCDGAYFDYGLTELLQRKDTKGVLSCGSDSDDRYYLLYHPRYPWDESGGFASQEEVVKYIYDLLRPFCRDDVLEKDLLEAIDVDVYANGCG
jgi:hypothetical protein